jgi:hypothetical protein
MTTSVMTCDDNMTTSVMTCDDNMTPSVMTCINYISDDLEPVRASARGFREVTESRVAISVYCPKRLKGLKRAHKPRTLRGP